MSELQREEFFIWMQTLQRDIQGVHERLDGLNGRTRTVENKVAVLEDRGVRSPDPTARWIGGLAMAGGVLWEVIQKLSGGAK